MPRSRVTPNASLQRQSREPLCFLCFLLLNLFGLLLPLTWVSCRSATRWRVVC